MCTSLVVCKMHAWNQWRRRSDDDVQFALYNAFISPQLKSIGVVHCGSIANTKIVIKLYPGISVQFILFLLHARDMLKRYQFARIEIAICLERSEYEIIYGCDRCTHGYGSVNLRASCGDTVPTHRSDSFPKCESSRCCVAQRIHSIFNYIAGKRYLHACTRVHQLTLLAYVRPFSAARMHGRQTAVNIMYQDTMPNIPITCKLYGICSASERKARHNTCGELVNCLQDAKK